MKNSLVLLVINLLLGVYSAFAQSTVTGLVVSKLDSEPVVGATVLVKGTTIGTITNIDGFFSISSLPESANEIIVSYIGMETQELKVRDFLRVELIPITRELDEVIIVAYGTAKKTSFTGAASEMKGNKLQTMQVSNLSSALEGTIAGVQVASSSGTPGSGASIIVRGLGSISSTISPLIVVDGVPYEGALNSIPTQDVESITVLKDAAANSLYGARGSNGVLLITTNTGRVGKTKVNFEGRTGFNTRGVSTYDIMTDAGQYYETAFESYRNSLISPTVDYEAASIYAAENLIDKLGGYNKFLGVADNQLIDPETGKLNPLATSYKWDDDWTKDPYKNGLRQEYALSVSGGADNTQIYASLGYLKDEGIVINSGFERFSTRLKLDHRINNYIKLGGNIAYSNTTLDQFGSTGAALTNLFMFSQRIAPIYPIYLYDRTGSLIKDEKGEAYYDYGNNGDIQRPYGPSQNPYGVLQENINSETRDNISTRGYFELKFLIDFTFTTNVAYDVFSSNYSLFYTPNGGEAADVGGRGYKYSTRRGALNANQLLNWKHSFDKHYLAVLLGHENKSDRYNYLMGHMTNFSDPNNPEFSNATNYQDLNSYTAEYALEGYFLKGEYNHDDKHFLTASFRRDGSSKFHPDNRWGNFWSVGAAWRITEELFMRDVSAITNLKLRASYGTQGNDNILNNGSTIWKAYSDLYTVKRVDGETALIRTLRGNKDLTWEKSENFDIGLEMDLFNRIFINTDFYIKETKNMLFASPLAASEGSPIYIYKNDIDMKNTGIEFEITADVIRTKNTKWSISFNGTHYKNQLTRLPSSKSVEEFPDGFQAGSYWRKLGGTLYDWYTYEYVGVDPENGKAMYNKYDTDENGIETVKIVNTSTEASLRQTGKSVLPDFVGGLSTRLDMFGFDLSIQTAFQFGGYVWDTFYQGLMSGGSGAGYNYHKDILNYWTPENTITTIPQLSQDLANQNIQGDYWLTSASYFSLRNVTLGYTLPTSVLRNIGVEKMRVYLVGDNIWLKSARKGLDPRQSFNGATGYAYSALSTYSLGLSLIF